jgi:hypothetical protein
MPPEDADGGLQLRAEDKDDLAVISACLQDALVPVGDIAYAPQDKSFVFVANRFRWEAGRRPARGAEGYERVLCAVAFEGVEGVLYRGFRREERGRILSLLAMRPEDNGMGGGGGAIRLDFSGGATVRLETGRILCRLKDVGLPWPTPWRPAHDLGEQR